MSAEICNLLVRLDEVRDDAACREADLEVKPDDDKAARELDDLRCQEADLIVELRELGYVEEV